MQSSEFFQLLDLERPGLSAVEAAAGAADWAAATRALAEYLRERESPRWFFSWRDRPSPTKVAEDFPKAQTLLRREFTYGFHGAPDYSVTFPDRIDWGANPTEGEYKTHLWNESLNRHFHFSVLSDAYWQTGDDRFAEGLVRDWVDWVEQNPRPEDSGNRVEWPYGCYSWQTLTTGIRLENTWPNALYRCLGSPAFTDDAIATILSSIPDQARHLVQWPTGHNWLTEECMGVYTAGMLFPEFKEAASWRQTAVERLYKQLTDEVYPDGAEYELAGGYGNWVVRNFVNLLERARMNGFESELPDDLVERMEKMFDYLLNVSMPCGRMPGLNDSGNADVTELLRIGHTMYPERNDFLYVASGRREGQVPDRESIGLPWSGHYVMRSGWDPDACFMLFDSGPYGSAHQHEDKLHFVLWGYGRQLVLDPGNFSYDASRWRRYVLTTPGHNTVMVDGMGQHRRAKRETNFWPRPWEGDAPPDNDTEWISSATCDLAVGTYRDGYGRPREGAREESRPERGEHDILTGVTHTRRVLYLRPDYWVVADLMDTQGDGEHTYESLFHLDATSAAMGVGNVVTTAEEAAANIAIVPLADLQMTLSLVQGHDDPVQGWGNDPWRPVPTAIFRRTASGRTWLAYALYPLRPAQTNPIAAVEQIPVEGTASRNALALAVRFSDGSEDRVLFSCEPGREVAFGECATDAGAAAVRIGADDEVTAAFQAGGSCVKRNGQTLSLAPDSYAVRRRRRRS